MKKEFKMSQERFNELKAELEYNKTTRADEVSEQIKIARGFGDLSENSEYDEAKNEQGKLYSRIAELEEILEHAVIVEESADNDTVSIGCHVVVTNLMSGKTMPTMKIVGSQEANAMRGAMSEDSPFGKAVMGKRVGDEVKVDAPNGVIPYRIEKIER
ncbi:MAG: transcription elongation factor GreA [Oscillospiraceae bacterium]|nr:transcription elongation factor GreA [Oscillospiraceae bacterium]